MHDHLFHQVVTLAPINLEYTCSMTDERTLSKLQALIAAEQAKAPAHSRCLSNANDLQEALHYAADNIPQILEEYFDIRIKLNDDGHIVSYLTNDGSLKGIFRTKDDGLNDLINAATQDARKRCFTR